MAKKDQHHVVDQDNPGGDGMPDNAVQTPPADQPGQALEPVIEARVISGDAASALSLRDELTADKASQDLAPVQHPVMTAFYAELAKRTDVVAEADAAVADIIAQVLSGESLDEVLADSEATGLRDMLNEPLTIYGWKAVRSDFEEGAPYYAVMDVLRHKKQWRGPVTTGAQTVLAQLVRIGLLDEYPATLIATNATKKPTKNGYWPLKLSKVPPTMGGSGL